MSTADRPHRQPTRGPGRQPPDRRTKRPRNRGPVPRRTRQRSAARHASDSIRILLADDHQILRESLASVLELQPDFDIVGQADNGSSAVALARELRPHVVVMDISMPQLDGVEATRRITRALPHTRVVGLSMHDEAEKGQAMRRAGAVAYLPKTAAAKLLIQCIRQSAAQNGPHHSRLRSP